NSGVLGLFFPSPAVISRTAGGTLLENILTFGQFDPSIANSSGSFTYSCIYQGSLSISDYWKPLLCAISFDGSIILSDFTQSRVPGSPIPIALGSGTTYILGPLAYIAAFWGIVGGARKGTCWLCSWRCWCVWRVHSRSSGC
ncbi:hypothetical protein EDB87DRAFT_1562460, partial [Lactarius vividus]